MHVRIVPLILNFAWWFLCIKILYLRNCAIKGVFFVRIFPRDVFLKTLKQGNNFEIWLGSCLKKSWMRIRIIPIKRQKVSVEFMLNRSRRNHVSFTSCLMEDICQDKSVQRLARSWAKWKAAKKQSNCHRCSIVKCWHKKAAEKVDRITKSYQIKSNQI